MGLAGAAAAAAGIGGLASGLSSAFGGNKPSGNTTTTTVNPTQQAQLPFLTSLWSNTQNTAATDPFSYYPGNTYAALNPTQTQALNLTQNRALSGSPVTNAAQGFDTALEGGQFLSAGNPYFSNTADSVLSNVIPTIESTFAGGNRVNSPGAAFATAQGATNAIAPYAFSNYGNTLNLMGSQAFNAPNLANTDYTNLNALLGAGNTSQQNEQNILNADIQRYYGNIQAPYTTLQTEAGLFGQPTGGSSSVTQPFFTNPFANVAGGAGAGLGLFNAINNLNNQNSSTNPALSDSIIANLSSSQTPYFNFGSFGP